LIDALDFKVAYPEAGRPLVLEKIKQRGIHLVSVRPSDAVRTSFNHYQPGAFDELRCPRSRG